MFAIEVNCCFDQNTNLMYVVYNDITFMDNLRRRLYKSCTHRPYLSNELILFWRLQIQDRLLPHVLDTSFFFKMQQTHNMSNASTLLHTPSRCLFLTWSHLWLSLYDFYWGLRCSLRGVCREGCLLTVWTLCLLPQWPLAVLLDPSQ